MRKLALASAIVAVSSLFGCLGELYGGDPRIQLRNRAGGGKIVDLRLGDPDRPAWSHAFDPQVDSAGISEVVELPAAGDLRFSARVTGTSLDTVISFQRRIPVGGFCQVEISRDADGRFRAKEGN
ncbi:MAG: hypothetical protein IPO40_02230 [Fibrobacteres bacterium]|nr:hypothetical protein [Fibrobacterota bacterium]